MQWMTYGYLADEHWLVEEAIRRKIIPEGYLEDEEYGGEMQGMAQAVEEIGKESGIKLETDIVWIGRGGNIVCYSLPDEMRPKKRTAEAEGRLQTLRALIQTTGEPKFYVSIRYPQPTRLRNVTSINPRIAAMRLNGAATGTFTQIVSRNIRLTADHL